MASPVEISLPRGLTLHEPFTSQAMPADDCSACWALSPPVKHNSMTAKSQVVTLTKKEVRSPHGSEKLMSEFSFIMLAG
jgi:hypothetical protein